MERPRAGVVITTGYVHVLGDAASILTDPCLGLSTSYPWAFVFATFATLLTFCLEYFLQRYFRARLGLPQIVGACAGAPACLSVPRISRFALHLSHDHFRMTSPHR